MQYWKHQIEAIPQTVGMETTLLFRIRLIHFSYVVVAVVVVLMLVRLR